MVAHMNFKTAPNYHSRQVPTQFVRCLALLLAADHSAPGVVLFSVPTKGKVTSLHATVSGLLRSQTCNHIYKTQHNCNALGAESAND